MTALPEPWPAPGPTEAAQHRGNRSYHGILPSELLQPPQADDADDAADWLTSAVLATHFLAQYPEATRRGYGADLVDFAAFCRQLGTPPIRMTRAGIDAYGRHLESARGLAASTVARRLSAVSGYYKRAVEDELLARSPMALVRRPKVPSDSQKLGLAKEEVQALLAAAEADGPRAHLLVAALALMGLRISELLNATVTDVTTERGVPVLRVRRKGGARAVLPCPPPVVEAMTRIIGHRRQGPLLATRTGRPLERAEAARLLQRVGRTALPDRRDLHPHLLRHAYVTLALDAGVPLRDVQDGAGHAQADTTRRYDRGRHALERNPTWTLTEYLALPAE